MISLITLSYNLWNSTPSSNKQKQHYREHHPVNTSYTMNGIWNESYMNCGYEIKWSYDLRSYERHFLQLRREAWKIQDFNWVWTRDLAIPVRRSNQLSYEATDVGSWSFVGSSFAS